MSLQSPPVAAHRCHCHASVITPTLPQRPSLAVIVCPVAAVPPTSGGTTEEGGPMSTTGAPAVTTAVGRDAEAAVPSSFVARTVTMSGGPTASAPARYVGSVAAPI